MQTLTILGIKLNIGLDQEMYTILTFEQICYKIYFILIQKTFCNKKVKSCNSILHLTFKE